MNSVFLVLLIALLSTAVVFMIVRGLAPDVTDLRHIVRCSRPVNVGLFRRLQNRDDLEFLKCRLSSADFRRVQRLRTRAELEYLIAIFRNAGILARVGDFARSASRAEVSKAGARLLTAAIDVRWNAALAITTRSVQFLWPSTSNSSVSVVADYERLRDQFAAIALMQCPEESSRVCAAL
jgi:hypothetical protein